MSNYQDENSEPYGTPSAGGGPGSFPHGQPGVGSPQGDGGYQYETQQFSGPGQQQWQGQPGYQGHQGHQGNQGHQGMFGSGGSGRPSLSVRSTFKTSEFWVMVVVAIALLIAAAVTDSGDDGQGFGAQQAWRYVTALAIAYIISRGLTKFGGHERGDHGQRNRRDY